MPTGFRYAGHCDEPLKRKPVGVRPSCFPGLISMAYIHPSGTQRASPRRQKQDSVAEFCSLKGILIGARFQCCGGRIAALLVIALLVIIFFALKIRFL